MTKWKSSVEGVTDIRLSRHERRAHFDAAYRLSVQVMDHLIHFTPIQVNLSFRFLILHKINSTTHIQREKHRNISKNNKYCAKSDSKVEKKHFTATFSTFIHSLKTVSIRYFFFGLRVICCIHSVFSRILFIRFIEPMLLFSYYYSRLFILFNWLFKYFMPFFSIFLLTLDNLIYLLILPVLKRLFGDKNKFRDSRMQFKPQQTIIILKYWINMEKKAE